jgi:Phage tail protein
MSDTAFELPILGVTPKNSLLIQKVTGLNPPDRSLFIGDYSQDGGIYQGRRVGSRNVVFTINLNPNPALGESVSSLRESLYKAFIDPQVDGDYLKLLLRDDADREIYLVGYCEKFESDIFDSTSMCQISMICPDPYLRDNEDTILTQPTGWVQVPFTYQGTAETGFVVRIYVTTPTNYITLHNNGKTMKLDNSTGYEADDIIIINTIRGQRSITLTKPGELNGTPNEFTPPNAYIIGSYVFYGPGVWECVSTVPGSGTTWDMAPGNNNEYWDLVSTPIISNLNASSQWIDLHSASNTMRVYEGDDPNSIVAGIKYLKYTSAYWGI